MANILVYPAYYSSFNMTSSRQVPDKCILLWSYCIISSRDGHPSSYSNDFY